MDSSNKSMIFSQKFGLVDTKVHIPWRKDRIYQHFSLVQSRQSKGLTSKDRIFHCYTFITVTWAHNYLHVSESIQLCCWNAQVLTFDKCETRWLCWITGSLAHITHHKNCAGLSATLLALLFFFCRVESWINTEHMLHSKVREDCSSLLFRHI